MLVRLALFQEYKRIPIRRTEIVKQSKTRFCASYIDNKGLTDLLHLK